MGQKISRFWLIVYVFYPPILRVLETIGVHRTRQDFLLGHLSVSCSAAELEAHLIGHGFERAILAWKEPGEVLSLRKLDREIFQYHLRLYEDGELRGHYEYSSEGNSLAHVIETCFEARHEHFHEFLAAHVNRIKPEATRKKGA
jgi:hypothetical protein